MHIFTQANRKSEFLLDAKGCTKSSINILLRGMGKIMKSRAGNCSGKLSSKTLEEDLDCGTGLSGLT
jgi:hypothetical protein